MYPTMRDHEETEELVAEGEEEHTEVKVMLEELKALDSTSSEFKVKIGELKDAVQHHVEEEENEIFPKVQESISDEELKQLATEFQQAQSKLQEEIAVASR